MYRLILSLIPKFQFKLPSTTNFRNVRAVAIKKKFLKQEAENPEIINLNSNYMENVNQKELFNQFYN